MKALAHGFMRDNIRALPRSGAGSRTGYAGPLGPLGETREGAPNTHVRQSAVKLKRGVASRKARTIDFVNGRR